MSKGPSQIKIITAALMILGFMATIAYATPTEERDCYCKYAQGKHTLVGCYSACTKNCGDGAAGCQDLCDKRAKCNPGNDKAQGDGIDGGGVAK